jgi:hypothetical protein
MWADYALPLLDAEIARLNNELAADSLARIDREATIYWLIIQTGKFLREAKDTPDPRFQGLIHRVSKMSAFTHSYQLRTARAAESRTDLEDVRTLAIDARHVSTGIHDRKMYYCIELCATLEIGEGADFGHAMMAICNTRGWAWHSVMVYSAEYVHPVFIRCSYKTVRTISLLMALRIR